MAAEKALALVVRGTDWSETSRITTLFTREFGKVRALAKGGRRLKSNFEIAFDLLTVCEIVFLRKAHGGLDLLTEARMAERFPVLRDNLPALYAGYYVAELLSDGTQDYDPHPPLFDAALETLRGLGDSGRAGSVSDRNSVALRSLTLPARQDATRSPALAVMSFELVWLRELGYSPRLDACAACGSELPIQAVRVLISPSAGGVLCPVCGPGVSDRRPISIAGLNALCELTAATEGDARPPELPPPVRGELRQLLGQIVSFVLGRRPRLLGYIEAAERQG